MHTSLTRIAFAALTLLAATAGSAAHAQATLNQSKALAGSVTPGDTAGFPVTLSVPGSYKLTGNLVVPAGLSGIEVTGSGVTLDLNGFNISGPITCSRDAITFAVTCSNFVASNFGVALKGFGNTVRNGQVRGFAYGVQFYGADVAENLLVEQNAFYGVVGANQSGARTLIRGVRSQLNGGAGFAVGDALVEGSTAASNGSDGFNLTRTVVLDSVAFNNKEVGFKGNNLGIGRSVAQGNKAGNIVSATSMGGNLNGNVPF